MNNDVSMNPPISSRALPTKLWSQLGTSEVDVLCVSDILSKKGRKVKIFLQTNLIIYLHFISSFLTWARFPVTQKRLRGGIIKRYCKNVYNAGGKCKCKKCK